MEDATKIDPNSESARWQRLKEIFAGASPLSGADLEEYLAGTCGSDVDLRRDFAEEWSVRLRFMTDLVGKEAITVGDSPHPGVGKSSRPRIDIATIRVRPFVI